MKKMVVFETNIDCAQRLLQRINEENWFGDNGLMSNARPSPQLKDTVEVFNETRPSTEKGGFAQTRKARMVVAGRRWAKGVLYVYLDIDPMWAKKAEIAKDGFGMQLFEDWINWR